MKFLFIFLFIILSVPVLSQADELTHAIGDTGYMIQDAMWANAYKLDRHNYNKAVRLQYEAKEYMRGTHKKGRHKNLAMQKTKEAYQFAKSARDNALYQSGEIASD
ncbi:hypothetical protein BVY03_00460 [bacterium K02(2017)]|nr:hypothetical protein BVY03_00460 [bacterium K02(2017)]